MRKIALGIICSGFIASSAWAAEPTTTTTRLVTSGALDGVTFTTSARAEQAAPAAAPEPAPKKVTTTVGTDFPTSYFFRGYRQEANPKFTFQPFVDVAVAGESASFNVGLWNSFHGGDQESYYETDFYAAVTVAKIKATYTAYTYPKYDNATIHELMFSTSFSGPLAPSAAIAFELSKASGADKGIYLELGINPAVPMKDDAPVTVTIPVKIGLGPKDYYFDANGDTMFGYFSAGVTIGHALSKGEIHGGVTVYGFGDGLKAVNNDKAGQVVGSVGFSVGF